MGSRAICILKIHRSTRRRDMTLALAFTLLAAAAARPAARPAAAIPPTDRAAAATITPGQLRAHIRFLASDLLEGRGPATRGDQLAETYIQTQMEGLGLLPGGADGSWLQPFDVVGMTSHAPATVSFAHGGDRVELKTGEEFIAFSGVQAPEARLDRAEVVFVGYGIVAPEYDWNDFKGTDLKGKVLLVMNNDPEDDPHLFAGKTRLYYGRWDYKYEEAARQGAAGVIIIHTEPSAGYKWQVVQSSWSGELFSLPHESGPQLQMKAWAIEDACRRLARLGGQDLDALRAAAQKREFRPVPLGVSMSLTLKNDVQTKRTANVLGRLPGRDPAVSQEAVIYTAHHDHLGIKEGEPGKDHIYNGALDNASGVAALLSIARAMTRLPQPPRRSVLFAAVAAEEQGLLGSLYLAQHPPIPAGRLVANLNMDGLNIWGRTHDLTLVGMGKSSLDDWIKAVATAQGRVVVPDQFPDKGFFYRSDQFSLAKIGVPAAHFDAGTEVRGKPAGWGKQQQQLYEDEHYHQPSDELKDDWDLSGAAEDAQLFFYVGVNVANAQRTPAWKPGDEFEAARKKALAALKQ
jgi:Zn-dependent M28 family amino/carboxypeptidase